MERVFGEASQPGEVGGGGVRLGDEEVGFPGDFFEIDAGGDLGGGRNDRLERLCLRSGIGQGGREAGE